MHQKVSMEAGPVAEVTVLRHAPEDGDGGSSNMIVYSRVEGPAKGGGTNKRWQQGWRNQYNRRWWWRQQQQERPVTRGMQQQVEAGACSSGSRGANR